MRPRVFVSGAFSSRNGMTNADNIKLALKYSHILAAIGFMPFTPHTAFGFISEKNAERYQIDESEFLEFCLDIMASGAIACMFMLPGWEESAGASIEHSCAQELGLYTIYDLSEAKEYIIAFTNSIL